MTVARSRPDLAGVLREAWRLALRDHAVLVALGGLFLFVPTFAVLLYYVEPPASPGFFAEPEVALAYIKVFQAWFSTVGIGILAAAVSALVGQVAIVLLYVDARRLDVGGALLAVPGVFLPALLAGLIANPLDLTLKLVPLLVLLGAYLHGRLMLTLPVLLAERRTGVLGAIRVSWTRTRGHGLLMAGLACVAVLAGPLVAMPIGLLGKSFDGVPAANPVVAALVYGTMAGVVAAAAVFGLLIQVAAYRRLSNGM